MKKVAILILSMFSVVDQQSVTFAGDTILKDRHFYSETQMFSGSLLPWLDIDEASAADDKEIEDLRDWLVKNEDTHGIWPPKYDSKDSAIQLIKSWQKMRKQAESLESRLMDSPETGALAVTFWVYGHNIDEPGAAEHAFRLIDELEKRFPDSALPPMLKGMFITKTGGDGAEPILRAADKKAKDKKTKGLIQLAIASRCQLGRRPHKMVTALQNSMDLCPSCGNRYMDSINLMQSVIGHNPGLPRQNPYIVQQQVNGTHTVSGLYGFMLDLPGKWTPDKYTPYNPENPLGYIMFNSEPLEPSGLIHGFMVFTAGLRDASTRDPYVYKKFFFREDKNIKITKIKPLVNSPHLTEWYRLDTNQRVGNDDSISAIFASGVIHPKAWTIKDHHRLAKRERECRSPRGDAEKMTFFAPQARINAPIEITFNYNGSKKTYAEAERRMKKIISSLIIEDHAMSEVIK